MAGYELTPEELKLYLEEAHEQLQIMEERLIALEEDPRNPSYIQEVFRAAHTLKGGSATAGFDNVARLMHAMESLLDQVRQGEREMSSDIADALFEGVDLLRRCLAQISKVGNAEDVDVEPLIAALEEQWELGKLSPGAAAGRSQAGATAPAQVGSPSDGQGSAIPGAGTGAAAVLGERGKAALGAAADTVSTGESGASGGTAQQDRTGAGHETGALRPGDTVTIEVEISPDALMSSVRAYQILLVLDDLGKIVSSEPDREAIESGVGEVRRVRVTLKVPDAATGKEPLTFAAIQRAILEVPDIAAVSLASGGDEVNAARPQAAGETATAATAQGTAVSSRPPSPAPPAAGEASAPGPAPGARPASAGAAAPKKEAQSAAAGQAAADANAASLGQTIRVDVAVLDNLMNLVGELVIDRTRIAQLASLDVSANTLREELTSVSSSLSRITTDLQDTIMQARMMPVDTLFKKFPRMIRDLSRQLGKEVDFEMSGNETELDRSVIEQIGDPLIHLLRNAIDHGIEPAEERLQAGKSARGKVRLHAFHQENHIYIQVSDDGRGLNFEKIKRKAVERGLLRPEEAGRASREQVYELIFAPGFSTADEVSSVSGRGVGMDVVRRNLERVNGSVTVTTEEGKGTTFTIKLPLTLVIVQALMVEIAGCVMAIPLSNVTEAVQITQADIHYARGWEMIAVRGEMVPLLNPAAVWGSDWAVAPPAGKSAPVVILRSGASPIGLKVSRLLGEQEIVIKAMGPVIGNVPGISGASILGDGRVALIIDAAGLTKAVQRSERTA